MADAHPRVVIACRIMQPEMQALQSLDNTVEVRYLDQNLHRTPDHMPRLIQEQIDAVRTYASKIILGYGLCSNGIVGVKAPQQGLYVPKAHDCITLFLGSRARYDKLFHERPGTYYLTPGWVAEEKDPLGQMENEYVPRMGREMAIWGIKEELKNYTHIALIDTQAVDMALLRQRAMENATFLGKKYEEIVGKPDYFQKILLGPLDTENFLFVKAGETVQQKPFLG
jgi:hypothetical protein